MADYDNLEAYNDEVVHNMWVDYDNYENTGAPEGFEDESLDECTDNLND